LRVLHINASYKPAFIYGGPTMSVAMLCEQLAATGAEVTVYTTTANGPNELNVPVNQPIVLDGVKVVYFKRLTKDHTHFSPQLLRTLWKNAKNFDLVHIHAWWNLVSVLACLAASVRKVPVVISPRGTLSSYSFSTNHAFIKRLIHGLFAKKMLQKAHIHVTAEQERNAMLNLFKPKGITLLPNLVKLPPQAQQTANVPSSYLRIIFLSRIEAKKGLAVLFSALPGVTIPYQLTIAGDGEENYINQLKDLAIANNISDKIAWVGFQGDGKFKMLAEHDVFILPSYDENFGNAVIESLAAGTAVLISENVGLAGYVAENKFGWVCENNAPAVCSAINKIGRECRDDLSRIRQQAPAVICRDFEPRNLAGRYLAMYRIVESQQAMTD
jgi:glycosyltransferase involved in cell wall biosynthesis